MLRSLILAASIVLVTCTDLYRKDRKDYHGYTILEIVARTTNQLEGLSQLVEDDQVYFRHRPTLDIPSTLVLGPDRYSQILSELQNLHVEYHTTVQDYGRVVEEELYWLRKRHPQGSTLSVFNLTQWNTYEDIMTEVDSMASRCSASIVCSTEILGQSDSGRDIKVLRISKTEPDRQGVWVDSTIHANEWLSPATMLYFFDFLTRSYDTDPLAQDLIDRYDWHYVPVMNPDGYVYSWEVDRDWRKSTNVNSGSSCIGTDLNRNYDSNWMVAGASNDTCSRTYAGSSPASEVETQIIQAEIVRLAPTLSAFLTVHIAAQMWIFPWGHTNSTGACVYAVDHDELTRVVNLAADATEDTFGTEWARGNTCETIYPAAGITSDFAYQSGIVYSFTPELRGPGNILTEDDIIPSYQEIRNGIVALLDAIENPV